MVRRAFSLLEILVCVAVIAVLVGILLPTLAGAKAAGNRAVCASNLRQIHLGFHLYLQDNKEYFPRYADLPEETSWRYGGAAFVGPREIVMLDAGRPINRYLGADTSDMAAAAQTVALFRCPSDRGVVSDAGTGTRAAASLLPRGSCFREFGTSYRANAYLLDSTLAGIDEHARPLRMSEVHGATSRVLLLADAEWWFATRPQDDPERALDASWHREKHKGNMLALDGSLRFADFSAYPGGEFEVFPRLHDDRDRNRPPR